METTEDIHQKLAYIHQNLKGKHVQWHIPINREDYSKVVLIRDVVEKNGKINLVFDNGSQLDYELLNKHLLMVDDPKNPPLERVNAKPMSLNEMEPDASRIGQIQETKQDQQVPKDNIFDMFPESTFNIPLELKAKLPDISILKLMYASAQDKDKFLSSVINKLIRAINEKSIKESIKKQLE